VAPEYRLHWVARANLEILFPNLSNSQWEIRSPIDKSYNCFAWAACDTRIRWEPSPDNYWPEGVSREYGLDSFMQGFAVLGYNACADAEYEFGFQKIAIYSESYMGEEWPTHMARQDIFGRGWLSKLGDFEDILHPNLTDLEGGSYGRVVRILRRSRLTAIVHFCAVKSAWASLRHWLYRRRRPHGI
jgi:hypothetical protein